MAGGAKTPHIAAQPTIPRLAVQTRIFLSFALRLHHELLLIEHLLHHLLHHVHPYPHAVEHICIAVCRTGLLPVS